MPRINDLNSFSEKKDHLYDDYHHQGYQYEGNILRHVLTPEIFSNKLNDVPMRCVERLFEYMINAVRQIKLHYAITFPKNSRLID